MEIRTNDKDKHELYDDYSSHQSVISELVKDDVVTLTINGVIIFHEKVLYGVKSHVNVSLQDKGELSTVLTDEQIVEAIATYKETL